MELIVPAGAYTVTMKAFENGAESPTTTRQTSCGNEQADPISRGPVCPSGWLPRGYMWNDGYTWNDSTGGCFEPDPVEEDGDDGDSVCQGDTRDNDRDGQTDEPGEKQRPYIGDVRQGHLPRCRVGGPIPS